MERKIVIVLGSGASVGSGYELPFLTNGTSCFPHDKNFFEKVWKKIAKEDDYACIRKINERLTLTRDSSKAHDDSLEGFWNNIDQLRRHIFDSGLIDEDIFKIDDSIIDSRRFPGGTEEAKRGKRYLYYRHYRSQRFSPICAAGNEMRNLITDVYGNIKAPEKEDDNNIKSLYLSVPEDKKVSVITFNYDLIFEDAVGGEEKCFYYDLEKGDDDKVEMLKLHGSFNWIQEFKPEEQPIRISEDRKNVGIGKRAMHPYDNHFTHSAIVSPDFFKQPINTPQTTPEPKISKCILSQWKQAGKRLEEAEKVVFVGFGFPPADYHAQIFFKLLLKRNEKAQILFCCKAEKNKEEQNRISDIIGVDEENFLSDGLEKGISRMQKFLRDG